MAITLRGTNSANAGGSFDINVPMPTGTATDDVVYAAASEASHTANFDITTTSVGWTELAEDYSNDTLDVNACLMRKVQGGTPDTTVRFRDAGGGSYAWGGVAIALIGVDTTTPEDATTTTATGIDAEDPDPPSITTVTNGAWVLAFGFTSEGDNVSNAPSGYSNLVDNGVGFGNNNWTMAATKEVATAGAEDPGAFTDPTGDTGDSWVAFTVAARPAGGGGSTYTLDADAAAYTYTATAAGVEFHRLVDADAASYTYSATDAGLEYVRQIIADSAAYTYTADDAALEYNRILEADSATYAYTASDAGLEYGLRLDADSASYAWTADDASLEYGRVLDADSAAYTWTADDATLEYTPAGSTYTLDADSATYLWSVFDADLVYIELIHRTLDADGAAYTWSANDAGLEWSGAVTLDTPRTGGGKGKRRRRRILLDDGRILEPADDRAYRAAVEQIIANFPHAKPEAAQAPKKRRYKGAVKSPEAVPKLAPKRALPVDFYQTLDLHNESVLSYREISQAWAAYQAQMADEEDVEALLLS